MNKLIYLFLLLPITLFANIVVENGIIERDSDTLLVSATIYNCSNKKLGNKTVIIEPYLLYGGDKQMLEPIIIKGRRAAIIDRRNGVKYDDEVLIELQNLQFYDKVVGVAPKHDVTFCANVIERWCCNRELSSMIKLAHNKGEEIRVCPVPEPIIETKVVSKDTLQLSIVSFLTFANGISTLNRNYKDNGVELYKIHRGIESILDDSTKKIVAIECRGSASPIGGWSLNSRLSWERAASVASYIEDDFDDLQVAISSRGLAENWSGLYNLVSKSSLDNKEYLLSIIEKVVEAKNDIDSESIVAAAKSGLAKYQEQYSYMVKNFYPQLRITEIVIFYHEVR